MKKIRLISLLLVALFVLTTFSGAFVFGDEATDTIGATEATEDGAEGEAPEQTADFSHEMGFNYVDPEVEENVKMLQAAEKAAEGRAVTVYAIELWGTEFTVERVGDDFLGVYVYTDGKMEPLSTVGEVTSSMKIVSYNLTAQEVKDEAGEVSIVDRSDLVGQDAYVMEITAVSSAEIANLPNLTYEERLDWKKAKRGKFTSEEQRVSAMTVYHTEGPLTLYVDEELAEFAIYNSETGDYFFSNPYDYNRVLVPSVTTKSQLASVLELEFYDNSANKKTLYSYDDAVNKTTYADPDDPDSVDNIQYWAEKIDGGVRMNFQIGSKELDTLLPYAAEVESFNTKVLNPLKEKADAGNEAAKEAYTKLIAFYNRGKVYSYDKLSTSLKQSISMEFPGIKEHDFYILRTSNLYNRDKLILSDYIRMTGMYTQADFDLDLELSGYEPPENFFACFEFYMDITLEDGQMKVDIPTDNIKYDDEHFTLTKISPIRYFGSGKYSDQGFVFVPDGSGVVIEFNADGLKNAASLSKVVYGDDYSLNTIKSYNNLTQSSYMPVFGVKANNRGYIAVIEKGDALATVQSETGNMASPFETAFATFVYRTVQTINYTDGTKQNGEFTYFNENIYTGGFGLRYILLYGEDTDYVDMATAYREYLKENGRLVDGVNTDNTNVPLLLETLGLIDKKASMMGIIYDKKIPMTTFDDAEAMISELAGEGVGNVSLRYRGWMNGGLNYSVPSTLKIENKLGGKSGFKKLVSFMQAGGYALYPEVDLFVVRRDTPFDKYSLQNNGPKMTDRTTITLTPRNELDNVMEIDKNYFAVSPSSLGDYFKPFFGKYNQYNAGSISLGTAGSMLYSDFSKNKGKNRQEALDILNSNVQKYAVDGGNERIMVEGGNAYTWNYADEIVDMPMSGSNTLLADRSVPFMQIVLHGHVQYAGNALNLADNWTNSILKSAEYGANLHFTLSAKNTRELKETVYSNYFTIDFDTWKEDVTTLYNKFNTVFGTLQDKEITDHGEYADNVYVTTYSDGTKVAVNYNRTDVTVEGKTVAAQDFTVL
ncbi:MAG: hypothetical protein E7552_05105 [Ruminococcaceae bacterium]|nr:hypothetical protein [Oscillospiraceae bacterium]